MQTIQFTANYWHEIKSKLPDLTILQDKYSNVDIAAFTKSFSTLAIIFQVYPEDSPKKVEEFKKMRRKTNTLELYLVLDYERIMQGNDEENLAHIKEVFHKGCATFLKPLKGFDWNEFEKVITPQLKTK